MFFRDRFFDSEERKRGYNICRRRGTVSTDRICVTKGDIRRAMGKCKAEFFEGSYHKENGHFG